MPVPQFDRGKEAAHLHMNDLNDIIRSSAIARRSPPPASPVIIKPIAPTPADKPVGRHAAIRSKLPNWHSYKSWVDKARGSWEEKK
jgi:hypothetical protein